MILGRLFSERMEPVREDVERAMRIGGRGRFDDRLLSKLEAMEDEEMLSLLGMSGGERIDGLAASQVLGEVRHRIHGAVKVRAATRTVRLLIERLEAKERKNQKGKG